MNIYFDIDNTIISYDGQLRPGVHDVFRRLRASGHEVYIWSGMGVRVPEVEGAGLLPLVSGVFEKPVERFEEGVAKFGLPNRPDAVVDDHDGIVKHFGGVCVRPYFWPDPRDRELERALMELLALAEELET